MDDDLPTPSEDNVAEQRYHFTSLLLNLVNTFLYMVNTYIIVPTADDYSLSLGAAATVCGVVIGSMAVAQVFSSVYFSAWSNRSYLRPLVFSSIMLLIGNTLYALAYDLNSIAVLLVGRLFCGLGSARAVNRRYISDCVPHKLRMRASAGFVSASALGMACGPALACLFQTDFKIYKLTFNQDTLPGWVMALSWLVYLLCLWISFREPPQEINENIMPQEVHAGSSVNYTVENGFTQPLLLNLESKQEVQNEDQEYDDGEEDSCEKTRKPVTSIVSAYRLLTPSVKVQLFVYFMLKYAMEILLAEASVITAYYFIWSTSSVAIFLACLGLTEVDPTVESEDVGGPEGMDSLFSELANAIPGIDEAMSFAEMLKLVQTMDYSCIVFDTAPTGHTLRLLQFPATLEKGLAKIISLKSKFGGLLSQMTRLFGVDDEFGENAILGRLEGMKEVIEQVNKQFKDPSSSLSMKQRLVQELTKFEIDTHNIIINQVIFDDEDVESKLLKARMWMQQKYLDQFYMLYDDFHITKLPLLPEEVTGVEAMKAFSHHFLSPYQPSSTIGTVEELDGRVSMLKQQISDAEAELEKLQKGNK
ncbi:hypothetical protein CRYUN_Cryun01aG0235200 [Craigia yunnanensis]